MFFLLGYLGNGTEGSWTFTISPQNHVSLGFEFTFFTCLHCQRAQHTPVGIVAQAASLFLKAGRPLVTSQRDPNSPSVSRTGKEGWRADVNLGFNQYAEQTVGPVFTQWSSTLCQGLWLSKRSPNEAETKETDKSCVYRSQAKSDGAQCLETPPSSCSMRKQSAHFSQHHRESPSPPSLSFSPINSWLSSKSYCYCTVCRCTHVKGKLRPRRHSKRKNPVAAQPWRSRKSHAVMSSNAAIGLWTSCLKGSEHITCAEPLCEQRSFCERPSISLVTVPQLLWGDFVETKIAPRRPARSHSELLSQQGQTTPGPGSDGPERQVKRERRLKYVCVIHTGKRNVRTHKHTHTQS